MQKIIILLTFFSSISAFAKKPAAQEDDVNFNTVEKLTEIRKKREQKIHQTLIDRVERNSKLKKEITLDDVLQSGTEIVVIQKGSEIIEFESNKKIMLDRNLTTSVYKQSDEFGYFYLKQKNDLIKFKVFRTNIHLLTEVVRMYEPPEDFVAEKYKKKFEYYDRDIYTNHQFAYDLEFINSNFTKDVLGEDSAITGRVTGYSYTFLTNWEFPVDMGLHLRYEQTDFDQGLYDYITNRSFLIGAQFNSKTIYWDTSRYQLMARIGATLDSRLTTRYLGGIDRYDLNTYSLEFGVERHFQNFLGEFVLGASYKKRWIELADTSNSSSYLNDLNSNDWSVGFYIAQRFGKYK